MGKVKGSKQYKSQSASLKALGSLFPVNIGQAESDATADQIYRLERVNQDGREHLPSGFKYGL